ncbi:MAG: hypothetical protein AAF514_18080, partial [Verrucomicrobiota bacterium]
MMKRSFFIPATTAFLGFALGAFLFSRGDRADDESRMLASAGATDRAPTLLNGGGGDANENSNNSTDHSSTPPTDRLPNLVRMATTSGEALSLPLQVLINGLRQAEVEALLKELEAGAFPQEHP